MLMFMPTFLNYKDTKNIKVSQSSINPAIPKASKGNLHVDKQAAICRGGGLIHNVSHAGCGRR